MTTHPSHRGADGPSAPDVAVDQRLACDLGQSAYRVRSRLIDLAAATSVHLGPCLSVVDILVAAYGTLSAEPAPDGRPPGRIILSKGHAAAALYFVLRERGLLTEPAERIGRAGRTRAGHPTDTIAGVEVPTGALGHGLAVGAGMALAALLNGSPGQVLVVMGDGELNEGSVWEAVAFARHQRLANLQVVIDRNGLQQSGRTADVLELEPLAEKWQSFGWRVRAVDGHDLGALKTAIAAAAGHADGPSVTIARTVKGRGVDFMEDDLRWHQTQLDEPTRRRAHVALAAAYRSRLEPER